jgi:hypothetical protein
MLWQSRQRQFHYTEGIGWRIKRYQRASSTLSLWANNLKKVIRQQDEDGKTPFSFLERAARKEVRRIEKKMRKN